MKQLKKPQILMPENRVTLIWRLMAPAGRAPGQNGDSNENNP